MARPGPEILKSVDLGDGSTWEILKADAYYAITYQDQPIGIRILRGSLSNNGHLYKKLTYTNLGNAQAQVVRLNHKFNTNDFSVMVIEI